MDKRHQKEKIHHLDWMDGDAFAAGCNLTVCEGLLRSLSELDICHVWNEMAMKETLGQRDTGTKLKKTDCYWTEKWESRTERMEQVRMEECCFCVGNQRGLENPGIQMTAEKWRIDTVSGLPQKGEEDKY